MMKTPDLHMHSTFSDGASSPSLLVAMAVEAGVDMMAITDHDTFAGADSLRGTQQPITVIPGVELSLRDMPHLHLLGYGLGDATALRSATLELARNRETRAERMIDRLAEHGMLLDAQAIRQSAQGTIGRPHIALAMVEKGYVRSVHEAFARFIGDGCPCYIASERFSMAEALEMMRACGFVPVLAHPLSLEVEEMRLVSLLKHWQRKGLMGMEVYHPSAMGGEYVALERIARRMNLLVTGGSDFHRANDSHGAIGSTAVLWRHAEDDTFALTTALREQQSAAERE